MGSGANSCSKHRPEYVGHVWSYDFAFDESTDGRRLKCFSVLEEYSRFDLALEVERRFTSRDVIATLDRLFAEHGAPSCIRSDNGPEFIANEIRKWLASRGVRTLYIEPGSPWENGYAESFHSTLRDELLDRELFGNVIEAQLLAAQFRSDYNHVRPHESLGGLTPAEFMERQNNERTTALRKGDLGAPRDLGTPSPAPGLS
jgi:transposase InsO family protein